MPSNRVTVCLALLAALLSHCPLTAADDGGFQVDFNQPDALESWQGAGQEGTGIAAGRDGSACVLVEVPAGRLGHRSIRARLPLDKLRGTLVRVECRVKAEKVAQPPQPYNGVKCMLHTIAPGGQNWRQKNGVWGTFDWRDVAFVGNVPEDATEAWLVLGLENTSGKAWFDDLKVTVIARRRRAPDEAPKGPLYKGHDLARLRGAMIGRQVGEEDLRVLGGKWKANHVRWQLIWGGFPNGPADTATVEEYNAWLETELARLDGLLPVCKELGIRVLIDVHTPPGGRNKSSECRMFHQKRFQEAFVANWEKIAARYKGKPAVWGYDLVNEPVEGVVAENHSDWRTLAEVTAKKIRAIDPDHAIIVEPAPWGSPQSLDWFEPLDIPGIVYSVHMYQPHQFTHQGIHGNPGGVDYPGEVHGKHWDRDALRRALKPAIDYQRDYNVHIYLGEFSAIRWAPGDSAYRYLRDVIDICEENGWDWAYHAFREWDGWSVEHGPDPKDRKPVDTPTEREKLLRSWYEKNERE